MSRMILRSFSLALPNRRRSLLRNWDLYLIYPMRFRQTTCAWEDSAVWAAPHHHRKADTLELLEPVPSSPAFRYSEQYDYFRPEKCKGDQGLSAFSPWENCSACSLDANVSSDSPLSGSMESWPTR